MMENDTPLPTTFRLETLKATCTWDRETAPETKNKTMRFKEKSRPGGQHSPSTATSSRVTCLKRQAYNSCVLPEMTYRTETWALTTHAKNKLAATQTKMERSMLNITYRDRKTNIWERGKTKVTDVTEQVRRQKWTWAGHVSRIRDNQWTLYHHLETLWMEKTLRKAGEMVERQTRWLLEGYHLAEDSTRRGSSMLKPSSNHGTLWLHNDDDFK